MSAFIIVSRTLLGLGLYGGAIALAFHDCPWTALMCACFGWTEMPNIDFTVERVL